MKNSEIIIVTNKEDIFVDFLADEKNILSDRIIVDFARLSDELLGNKNYEGICW